MKKFFTILIFFIFSASIFAKWEVEIDSLDTSSDFYIFNNISLDKESVIAIAVDIQLVDDFSAAYNNDLIAAVFIYSDKIELDNNYYLKIKRNSGSSINYNISENNIAEISDSKNAICIGGDDKLVRGAGRTVNNLIKILSDSSQCDLYSRDSEELLARFNWNGLKEIMKENIGDTEWYKRLYE